MSVIVIGSPKSLINVQKGKEIFAVAFSFIRPPKIFVNGPLELGHGLAHSLSRSRLEQPGSWQAGQPAFSYKNNAHFMRQQKSMSQASPGNRAGSPRINRP